MSVAHIDLTLSTNRARLGYLYHSALIAAKSMSFHSSFQSCQYGMSLEDGA